MTRVCTTDVNFIFALNDVKKEINKQICESFLRSIDKLGIEFVTFESVKKVYDYTISTRLDLLKKILKELHMSIASLSKKNKLTIETFFSELKDVFDKYKGDKSLGNKRAWVRIFETNINCMIQTKDLNKSNVILEIMHESHQIIRNYESIASSCFNLLMNKSSNHINITPKSNIINEVKKIINDNEDCNHIASVVEYGITENKWIFFISLDEEHITSKKQKDKIQNKFQLVIPMEPNYATFNIKQFNTNIKEAPLTHLKNLVNNSSNPPINIIEFDVLSTQLLGIKII